jgi:hypothetical protein
MAVAVAKKFCTSLLWTVVVAKGKLHPRTGHEDPEWEERHISTFSLTSALDGVSGKRHVPTALPSGKDPLPIVQEAGWTLWAFWLGADNLGFTGIRSLDFAARCESPHRLRYPL